MSETYVLDGYPVRGYGPPGGVGLHCRAFGVRSTAASGHGRPNLFFVTPKTTLRGVVVFVSDTADPYVVKGYRR